MHDVLRKLGLESVNAGGFCGEWIGGGEKIDSVSPIDGKGLAAVKQVTPEEYDRIVDRAYAAFLKWRQVPAPVRGETVRQLSDALRKHKADLGAL
ncbi:MAG: aldehyde dehydrogenase family protein, partial [Planctomycetota bacterium]